MLNYIKYILVLLILLPINNIDADVKDSEKYLKVKKLLETNEVFLDKHIKEKFDLAIEDQNLELVENFLNGRAKFFLLDDNNYYLHWAVTLNNTELIDLFLKHNININSLFLDEDGLKISPLALACKLAKEKMAFYLLEKKATPKLADEIALYWAGRNKMYNLSEYFLKEGLDPNKISHFGRSPFQELAYSSLNKQTDILDLFLKHDAQVNSQAKTSLKAPLHFAALRNEQETLKWLLKNGADIDQKDAFGFTALILAGAVNNKEAVQILIENKADINAVTNDFESITHLTTDIEIIKILVKNSANLNLVDKKKNTPLDNFIGEDFKEINAYLKEHGAKNYKDLKR